MQTQTYKQTKAKEINKETNKKFAPLTPTIVQRHSWRRATKMCANHLICKTAWNTLCAGLGYLVVLFQFQQSYELTFFNDSVLDSFISHVADPEST